MRHQPLVGSEGRPGRKAGRPPPCRPALAEACWARWKLPLPLPLPPLLLLLPEPMPLELEPLPGVSSTSTRRRLPRPGRPAVDTLLVLLLEVALEMVTREDGVGVSFSLGVARGGRHRRPQGWGPGCPKTPATHRSSSPSSSFR